MTLLQRLLFTFVAVAPLVASPALAYGPGLVFSGGTTSYASFNCAGFPSGNSPRTLEAWLRVPISTGPLNDRGSVVELGQQQGTGSAFGLQVEGTRVGFWGHNADQRGAVELPDDQWHHVALTYSDMKVAIYLDGAFKGTWPNRPLNTSVGTCYIGAYPQRQWYLRGSVGGIKVWSGVRTGEQIRADMTGFPSTTGDEPGLVAAFDFSEQQGARFSDLKKRFAGTLQAGAAWNKALPSNPEVGTEGIWFVIQNKADVASDFGVPARRMALTWNDKGDVVVAAVPLTGNYDKFLWRVQPVPGGVVKLVNKGRVDDFVLDSSQQQPLMARSAVASGQSWQLSVADKARWGTNTYHLANLFIGGGKRIAYRNGRVVVEATKGDQEQGWVLQPMEVVLGYRIPTNPARGDDPWTRALGLDRGQTLKGTNTVSEWAMLNAHNIYANMVNAFKDRTLRPEADAKKVLFIFGRYDFLPCKYPGIWEDCATVNDWRGYSGNETVITEELMCRTGVYSRGIKDAAYSEFHQVVHEYAHTLNYQFFKALDIDNSPGAVTWGESRGEWYPWKVQAWFNSAQGIDSIENRASLPTATFNYLAQMFDKANSWLPPRLLREVAPIPPTFVVAGTLLPIGTEIKSPDTGAYSLKLQSDGKLVVKSTKDNVTRWDSSNNLKAPTKRVKSVLYFKGKLHFTTLENSAPLPDLIDRINSGNPTPEILRSIQLHVAEPTASYRLYVSDDPNASGSYLRVLNVDGWKTVWSSGR